ncbi:MAG: M48 family metallopeptidase [Deltaproteobacteria bacterium]|nr:M48 family metallopeptidase [Deltaproteobacteria bacterium]
MSPTLVDSFAEPAVVFSFPVIQLVVLGFLLAEFAVETLLDGVYLATLARGSQPLPAVLAQRLAPEAVAKSRAYAGARLRLGLAQRSVAWVAVLAVLFGGGLTTLEHQLTELGLSGTELSVGFLLALAAGFQFLGVPFALVSTFGIERRFGFNRQTWGGWLADQLKGWLVSLALGVPFLLGAVWFVSAAQEFWWLWLAAFILGVQWVLVWLFPTFIAPLFNRFTPLPAGELRERVEAQAKAGGFRPKGVFEMDASRRSGHSNAYFTGLGRSKRIVLFDTLLKDLTPTQIEAVMAHEIGHYKLGHIRRRLAWGAAFTFGLLFAASLAARQPALYQAFGLTAPTPHGLLALLVLAGGPLTFWLAPAMAGLSRRHEFQADAYARQAVGRSDTLAEALVKLSVENLSNPTPHPWYVAWHASHPPLAQRLAALEK